MARAPRGKRYAQALFAIAVETGSQEAWLDELRLAREALDDPTVAMYLGTPRVLTDAKLDIVAQLLEGREPMVANLVGLLVSRQGTGLLGAVMDEYSELLNQSLGRARATVTTATPLSDEQRARLRESLGVMLDREIVVEANEDPEIIGGVVVRVGDQIIDGSVRTRLVALRQRLERES